MAGRLVCDKSWWIEYDTNQADIEKTSLDFAAGPFATLGEFAPDLLVRARERIGEIIVDELSPQVVENGGSAVTKADIDEKIAPFLSKLFGIPPPPKPEPAPTPVPEPATEVSDAPSA